MEGKINKLRFMLHRTTLRACNKEKLFLLVVVVYFFNRSLRHTHPRASHAVLGPVGRDRWW